MAERLEAKAGKINDALPLPACLKGGNMTSWKCQNCGYTFTMDAPPDQCPSCKEKCEFLDNSCYTPDCAGDGMDKRIAKK